MCREVKNKMMNSTKLFKWHIYMHGSLVCSECLECTHKSCLLDPLRAAIEPKLHPARIHISVLLQPENSLVVLEH